MKQGRIEVTNITNYKRIKNLIKKSKHIGLVDKAGFRELLTCDIPALTKPKGFVLIDEMSVRDYKKSSKWKYIKRALDRNQSYHNPIQEILIFDTRFEALQWLAKSDSIFVKMQELGDQPFTEPDGSTTINLVINQTKEPDNQTTKEPDNQTTKEPEFEQFDIVSFKDDFTDEPFVITSIFGEGNQFARLTSIIDGGQCTQQICNLEHFDQ